MRVVRLGIAICWTLLFILTLINWIFNLDLISKIGMVFLAFSPMIYAWAHFLDAIEYISSDFEEN